MEGLGSEMNLLMCAKLGNKKTANSDKEWEREMEKSGLACNAKYRDKTVSRVGEGPLMKDSEEKPFCIAAALGRGTEGRERWDGNKERRNQKGGNREKGRGRFLSNRRETHALHHAAPRLGGKKDLNLCKA